MRLLKVKKKSWGKILAYNATLFPFFVALTYLFLLLETYLYIGFLRHFFLLDSRFFLVITLISGATLTFSKENTINQKSSGETLNTLIFSLNTLFLPMALIFYMIMPVSEAANYSNYVYSTFHLQPNNFFYIVIFSTSLMVFDQLGKRKRITRRVGKVINDFPKKFKKSPIDIGLKTMILVVLLLYLIDNISATVNSAINSNLYILSHLNDSYDEKMRKRWGFYYDFMKFVNEHADDSSTIVVPPKRGPWLTVGNAGLGRYFVYPNRVINGGYDYLPDEEYEYVVIAWGGWLVGDKERYGWPKVPIKADKVWYIDPDLSVEEYDDDYEPSDTKNEKAWGLIKVERKI